MARVGQVEVIERQILEPGIGGLHENLRLVSGAAQHALNAEHLVADGVAVAERGQDLVDRNRPLLSDAPPPRRRAAPRR